MGDSQVKKYFLLLVALFLCGAAVAETIPATNGSNRIDWNKWTTGRTGATVYPTAQAACQAAASTYTPAYTSPFPTNPTGSGTCRGTAQNGSVYDITGYTGSATCPAGYSQTNYTGYVMCAGYQCPAGQNWTLSGSQCTRPDCVAPQVRNADTGICETPACPAGYDRNAQGQCVKNCTGKQGQPTVNGTYEFSGPVSEWAVGECKVKCPVRVLAAGGGVGEDCKFTGASASPDQPEAEARPKQPNTDLPPEKPLDCLAQGKGYIQSSSGTLSCVASGDAPPDNRPKIEHEPDPTKKQPLGPDGQPIPGTGSEEGKSVNNPGDGTIEEKRTTTKPPGTDGSGNPTCEAGFQLVDGKCQKTESTKKPAGEYCAENPTSPVCRGSDESDACIAHPERAGCKDLGSYDGAGDALQTKAVGLSAITPFSVGGSGSCPADVTLPKGMGTWSFEKYCWFAESIRPLVLLLGWLIGGFIVFGFRGGSA